MTLSAILEILLVILVQCSLSILQNFSVILKIPSAILSNDYRGLAGRKVAHGSVKRHWAGAWLMRGHEDAGGLVSWLGQWV
jgi:hypothetical protein